MIDKMGRKSKELAHEQGCFPKNTVTLCGER